MVKNIFSFFFLCSLVSTVFAESLSLDTVIASTKKHHPRILMSLYHLEEQEGSVKASDGAFDTQLDLTSTDRSHGYYTGSGWDISLSKPLKILNAKIYTGIRKSNGNFPSYEGDIETQNGGEARLGIGFNLWGQRDIDEKRLKLWNEELKANVQKEKLKQIEISLEAEATKAYWKWIVAGNKLSIYEKLYQVAVERNGGLEKRVKKGDLAEIYLTENRQYILKRKTLVLEANQEFQQSKYYLGFFYRDDNGNLILPDKNQIKKMVELPERISHSQFETDLKKSLAASPILKQIAINNNISLNELKYGETLGAPTVNLKLEQSDDYGDRIDTLDEPVQKVMVELNFSLERSQAKGLSQSARAKQKRLKMEAQYVTEQIQYQLNNLYQQLLFENQIIENVKDEVTAASLLEIAEVKKFNRGASDFFLVNIREQNSAEVKIKLLESQLRYLVNYAQYQNSVRGVVY